MSNVLEYKGYCGSVEYSAADDVLFGKVLGISGLISYEGNSIQSLKEDFEAAIDDYLRTCAENHEEPQKPYKGSFNLTAEEAIRRYVTE